MFQPGLFRRLHRQVAGHVIERGRDGQDDLLFFQPMVAALLFVVGFGVVFVALGATASEIGALLLTARKS